MGAANATMGGEVTAICGRGRLARRGDGRRAGHHGLPPRPRLVMRFPLASRRPPLASYAELSQDHRRRTKSLGCERPGVTRKGASASIAEPARSPNGLAKIAPRL